MISISLKDGKLDVCVSGSKELLLTELLTVSNLVEGAFVAPVEEAQNEERLRACYFAALQGEQLFRPESEPAQRKPEAQAAAEPARQATPRRSGTAELHRRRRHTQKRRREAGRILQGRCKAPSCRSRCSSTRSGAASREEAAAGHGC